MSFFGSLRSRSSPDSEPSARDREAMLVWNRGCDLNTWPPVFASDAREGDRRLRYMLAFDSMAQADGLLDAMSHMGSDGTREAIAAFRSFDHAAAAEVIERAWRDLLPAGVEWSHEADLDFDVLDIQAMSEEEAEQLDARTQSLEADYYGAAADLSDWFSGFFEAHRDLFAPAATGPD